MYSFTLRYTGDLQILGVTWIRCMDDFCIKYLSTGSILLPGLMPQGALHAEMYLV